MSGVHGTAVAVASASTAESSEGGTLGQAPGTGGTAESAAAEVSASTAESSEGATLGSAAAAVAAESAPTAVPSASASLMAGALLEEVDEACACGEGRLWLGTVKTRPRTLFPPQLRLILISLWIHRPRKLGRMVFGRSRFVAWDAVKVAVARFGTEEGMKLTEGTWRQILEDYEEVKANRHLCSKDRALMWATAVHFRRLHFTHAPFRAPAATHGAMTLVAEPGEPMPRQQLMGLAEVDVRPY